MEKVSEFFFRLRGGRYGKMFGGT